MEVKEPSARYLARPRYRQTEVGVIPEDWDVRPLDAIAHVTSGKRLPLGRALTDHETPHPYIRVTDMRPGTVSLADLKFVPVDAFPPIKRYRIFKEDIFISVAGTLGIVGKIPPELDGANLTENADRITDITCSQDYLLHVLMSPLVQNTIDALQTVGAQPKLALARIRKFDIPVPPTKAEQEAIAGALSDADALIESLEQLLAKKRQLKQGAMQELLTGKKRLPGFSGEWVVKALGEVAQPRKERIDPRRTGPKEFCIELEHIEQGIGSLVGHTTTSDDSSLKSVFYKDDVLFGKLRAYLRKYWLASREGVCSTEIWVLVAKQSILIPQFLFQLVKLDRFIEAASSAYGTHMPRSDWNVVKNYEIRLPTPSEQVAIAAILSDMDAEIAAVEGKLVKARQIKQGMMQELLTGKIRLVQPEANVVQMPAKKEPAPAPAKSHNWQINEAVVISVLAKNFGSEQWPLGRKRCTKLSYLLHRHVEGQAEGYLKKAAGPYNPATKYKGPEGIALKNGYVRRHSRDRFSGFVAAEKIDEAESYFAKWYGKYALAWLEQFRLKSNDELELLATVDMAMVDLRRGKKAVQLANVKRIIRDHPEWEAKLDRAIFSDDKIIRAMKSCQQLFGSEGWRVNAVSQPERATQNRRIRQV